MENVLNIENWIVVGQAALKVLEWAWPMAVLFVGYLAWEHVTTTTKRVNHGS